MSCSSSKQANDKVSLLICLIELSWTINPTIIHPKIVFWTIRSALIFEKPSENTWIMMSEPNIITFGPELQNDGSANGSHWIRFTYDLERWIDFEQIWDVNWARIRAFMVIFEEAKFGYKIQTTIERADNDESLWNELELSWIDVNIKAVLAMLFGAVFVKC